MNKLCNKCKELKSFEDFYKDSNKCKSCISVDRKEYRAANLVRIRDSDRNRRRKSNMTDMQWESRKIYCREYAKANSEIIKAVKLKYIETNPLKRAAHVFVGNAIRDGRLLKQPCEVCGSKEVHAHHRDYSRPLEVMWLCPEHHSEWHILHGEGLNAA